jgi:nucleoside-triphosphatase THEP1
MQTVTAKPLRQIWLKASAVGSIWASIEIILGSFLHNLKIPLSGTILSFISVWLLISFLQVWKENGLAWRAGIICALMKSISPSAIIVGPMIGIFTEAILIELFIFLFGKNLIGYMIGGAFAVLSTLIHKLVSLIILYSFDFIKILSDLYQFAVKQIKLESLSPAYLIGLITIIYIVTGIAGAILGYITGLKYRKDEQNAGYDSNIILESGNRLFSQTTRQSYSVLLLVINIFSIIIILFLVNYDLFLFAGISAVVYISFCILNYRNSLRRLKKPGFWFIFIIITFSTAFLWNRVSEGAFFTIDGLLVGLRMNARAIVLVVGFTAISVELKNPLIKSVLYHRGFASLYQSLGLSFSALPYIISNISKQRKDRSERNRISYKGLFRQADGLLKIFGKEHLGRPVVVIITGDVQQGKTTFTRKVVAGLVEKKVSIAGFLAIGIHKGGKRTGFTLYDIKTSEEMELCSGEPDDNKIRFGHYYFNNDAIEKGREILNIKNLSGNQLIVIDEVGPLELTNRGWNSAIEDLCRNSDLPQLWVVRRDILKSVIRKWNIGDVYIFDIATDSVSDVIKKAEEIITY